MIEKDMIEREIKNKINFVNDHIKELVGSRWKSKKELSKYLKKKYEIEEKIHKVDNSGLVYDYAYIVGITKYYGGIDIYYLKIPYGDKKIYITEVFVSVD